MDQLASFSFLPSPFLPSASIPPYFPCAGANLGSGNRCGHDPKHFAEELLDLPMPKCGHWTTVQKIFLREVINYFYKPDGLSVLSDSKTRRNKDGTPRQNRSEAREAQSLVLSAIITMLDLASLRVGTPLGNGGFRNASCYELARRAGLTKRGKNGEVISVRFWRALARLKEAAAITVYEQYEELLDGSKRARVAIKKVSESFLVVLGKIPLAKLRAIAKECAKKQSKFRNARRAASPQEDDVKQAEQAIRAEQQKIQLERLKGRKPQKNQGQPNIKKQNEADEVQRNRDALAEIRRRYPGVKFGVKDMLRLIQEFGGS